MITGPFPIKSEYNTIDFDCGIDPLNVYLQKHAYTNHKNGSSRTYVAITDKIDSKESASCNIINVVGYFSLAYGSVEHSQTPPRITQGLGRYPVPVLILARLAIDISFQNIGLGRSLLKHTFLKAINASEIAGLRALVVHAKDDTARKFYEKFGFSQSPLDPLHLFLLLKDIQKQIF